MAKWHDWDHGSRFSKEELLEAFEQGVRRGDIEADEEKRDYVTSIIERSPGDCLVLDIEGEWGWGRSPMNYQALTDQEGNPLDVPLKLRRLPDGIEVELWRKESKQIAILQGDNHLVVDRAKIPELVEKALGLRDRPESGTPRPLAGGIVAQPSTRNDEGVVLAKGADRVEIKWANLEAVMRGVVGVNRKKGQ